MKFGRAPTICASVKEIPVYEVRTRGPQVSLTSRVMVTGRIRVLWRHLVGEGANSIANRDAS